MESRYNYTIVALDEEHVDEICEDIKYQYENNIADLALFEMPLSPEGNPVMDKAEMYLVVYDKFREKLARMGLECGILVQSTIGHGVYMNESAPYQHCVGRVGGKTEYRYCPYDDGLRKYFRDVMAKLAARKPKAIMVDDDFRLMFSWGKGCACPLHMKKFHELTGTQMTREELNARIAHFGEDDPVVKAYIKTQEDSVLGAAKAMREGIDSVDKSIKGIFCGSGIAVEFAAQIAEILAGKGNPSVVRLHNGVYTPVGTKGFSAPLYRMAQQAVFIRDKVNVLLAENDTCPHNRYAMSARQLHSFLIGAVLEGTVGTKRWITKLDNFEPKSGKAYREILAKNSGAYVKIAELVKNMTPVGCRIPLYKKPYYGLADKEWDKLYDGWSRCALDRLGLPLYFSEKIGGAVFLEGEVDKRFNDCELKEMLSGTVIMASDTAERLIARGFGEYIGVGIREYTGPTMSGEKILPGGKHCSVQKNAKEIVIERKAAVAASVIYHGYDDGKGLEELFPGSTIYKNSLDGTSIVFAGTPVCEYYYTEGFSFLNASRKEQLVQLLRESGNLPIYYDGDAEMYMRAGRLPGGEMCVVLFNLGFDPIEQPELFSEDDVSELSVLYPDGSLRKCEFIKENGRIIPKLTVEALLPEVLILK